MLLAKFTSLTPTAKSPLYAKYLDSGFDICADKDVIVQSNAQEIIPVGWTIELPCPFFIDTYERIDSTSPKRVKMIPELQIRSRSGLSANNRIVITQGVATIDNQYRGEVKLLVTNFSAEPFEVSIGDKLAQGVIAYTTQIVKVWDGKIISLPPFDEKNQRGSAGFGSTGVKSA